MISQYAPEALDRTLQDLRKNNHQFGGITMVFGGDFQQVLPVIPKGSREMVVHATFCKSPLWRGLTVFHLTWNMCLENGANPEVRQFAEWLLDVGHGHNRTPPLMLSSHNLWLFQEVLGLKISLEPLIPISLLSIFLTNTSLSASFWPHAMLMFIPSMNIS